MEAFPLVRNWTDWCIDNNHNVRIREDQWLGSDKSFRLSTTFILHLQSLNIQMIHDACVGFPQPRVISCCRNTASLGLQGEWVDEWSYFISLLCEVFIYLGEDFSDSLVWSKNMKRGKFWKNLATRLGWKIRMNRGRCGGGSHYGNSTTQLGAKLPYG